MLIIFTAFLCTFAFCIATRQEYGLCSQVYLMSQYCSKKDVPLADDVRITEPRVGKSGARGPRGPPGERGLPGIVNYSDIEEKMAAKVREIEEKFDSKFSEYEKIINQSLSKIEKESTAPPATGCHAVKHWDAKVTHRTGGVFTITSGKSEIDVVCDLTTDGGRWTVFQRRFDGSQDFNQYWRNYVDGFGDLSGEFWLGLEKLHLLTQDGEYELRIELTEGNGRVGVATYQGFSVTGSSENYMLNVGQVLLDGLRIDQLSWHNNMAFSTRDRDNDKWSDGCAAILQSGWWFNVCVHSNLNGVYRESPGTRAGPLRIFWSGFSNIKKTEMKFRKK